MKSKEKNLTMLEKFTLTIGVPVFTKRAQDLSIRTDNALKSGNIKFTKIKIKDPSMFHQWTFKSVDIKTAAEIGQIFDSVENKLIKEEGTKEMLKKAR